jgi:GNAT superfamily N-acetyltransferase
MRTLGQTPALRSAVDALGADAWPQFLLHGDVRRWHLLFDAFPEYQLLLLDPQGELLAVGHTVPFSWDGSPGGLPATIEDVLAGSAETLSAGRPANSLVALAVMVARSRRGQGLSRAVLTEMRALAASRSFTSLLAPVRPTWKCRYPLTPMESYAHWKKADGSPFDPWIRVHWRLGAAHLGIAPATVTVEGSVRDWESWTGMSFPESGSYIVPEALQPVWIDLERDLGRYEDPNCWMRHPAEA